MGELDKLLGGSFEEFFGQALFSGVRIGTGMILKP